MLLCLAHTKHNISVCMRSESYQETAFIQHIIHKKYVFYEYSQVYTQKEDNPGVKILSKLKGEGSNN